jgi:hypothetical protein
MVPETTPVGTQTQAPEFVIPASGVWVRVNYEGLYAASIGTPGAETAKSDSGDHLYQVPTSEGIVVASAQKVDASGRELVLVIYKDGTQVAQKKITAPKGIAELQVDLRPTPTPTTVAPTTLPTSAETLGSAATNATATNTTAASQTPS